MTARDEIKTELDQLKALYEKTPDDPWAKLMIAERISELELKLASLPPNQRYDHP